MPDRGSNIRMNTEVENTNKFLGMQSPQGCADCFFLKHKYQQDTMKKNKKVSDAFGYVCVSAIFAACVAEGLDGGISAWNLICLAVALAAGILSRATDVTEGCGTEGE